MDFLNSLLPTIEHFRLIGYWVVLLIALLDSIAFVGLAIPGTLLIVFFGFISAKGFLDIGDVVWFVAIGAILGDILSYYLGRHVKRFFQDDSRIFKSKYLNRGKLFFNKYSGRSILIGRFIGPMRPVIPFVAGLFKMNKKRFFLWDILSSFVWSATFLLLGFLFGQAWQAIALWSTRVGIFIAALVGLFIVFYILKWFTIRNGRQVLILLVSVSSSIKQAILNNPDVQGLIKRHSIFFRFIKNRFDKNRFSGLPTTFLLFSFIYVLILFTGIIEAVVRADTIVSVDTRVANLLSVFRGPGLTEFFLWVTLFGKWQIIIIFTLAIVIILWWWRKRIYIAPLFLAVIGTGFFTWFGKLALHRPRPEVAIYTEQSFSFPSGHAAIAIAFYGFILYLLVRNTGKWKAKVNSFFIVFILVFLIGFSRLYLGVHYLSDVWGGYLVGMLWLIVSISISEWLFYRQQNRVKLAMRIKNSVVPIVLISAAILFYIVFAFNYNPPLLTVSDSRKEILVGNIDDIFSNNQLKYTETVIGESQEPLSFIVFADSDERFIQILNQAGWLLADKVSGRTVVKLFKAGFSQQQYSQAPMTPSFWNSQVHDFGFEKPTAADNVRQRHHVRFWKTNYISKDGKRMYVGTASLDIGLKWGITHKIEPDIDSEREFLYNDLIKTGQIIDSQKKKFVKPNLGQNFSGDLFFTDGELYTIIIK